MDKSIKKSFSYMVCGIKVRNAMWNASFESGAKQDALGNFYATPYALEYAIREQYYRDGLPVLCKRRYSDEGAMNLKENFEFISGKKPKDFISADDIKREVLKFKDILDFGLVFTAKGYPSFGLTGIVQIGFAKNFYEGTETIIDNIISCFSSDISEKSPDKKKKDEESKYKHTTIGNQFILDKAEYLYDITINPNQCGDLYDYTEADFEAFKLATIKAVSNINSKSKKGCTNNFALIVTTKDDVKDSIDLNCLSEFISVDIDEEDKTIYDLTRLIEFLNPIMSDIKNIEIYYDNFNMELIGDIENIKTYNIRTKREVC